MKRGKQALGLIFGIVILSLLYSCSQNDLANELSSGDPDSRDLAYLSAQTALISDKARSRARELIRSAERKRTEQSGLVRESIDFSQGSIRYYAASSDEKIDYAAAGTDSTRPLEIVDFGPEGELPIENRRPNIYVMFNQPMVPVAKLGSPMNDASFFRIEPPIEGVYPIVWKYYCRCNYRSC